MRTRWIAAVAALAAFTTGVMLTTAVHAQGQKSAKAPKTTSGKPTTTTAKGPATKPTTTASKGKKSTTTTASTNGNGKKSTPTTADSTSNTTSTTSPTSTTSTPVWTPTNAVSEKLASKSNLMAKAQKAIGADVDLNVATYGFKSFGQFMAAVNASNNHGVRFEDLHAAMTGYTYKGTSTSEGTQSLGQALKQLKPGIDADAAADAATQQATKETGGQ
jgi:hypothetical protein